MMKKKYVPIYFLNSKIFMDETKVKFAIGVEFDEVRARLFIENQNVLEQAKRLVWLVEAYNDPSVLIQNVQIEVKN